MMIGIYVYCLMGDGVVLSTLQIHHRMNECHSYIRPESI